MKKILVIEDDISIAELKRDYLEINNFSVDIETDGNSGLRSALGKEYDLILLDLMLPGIDGFEILKRIRKNKLTPVVIVSARKEDIDKIRGLGLGADDYITKPFSPGELVARVKAHIARFERLTNNSDFINEKVEIGEISIDIIARKVLINEKEIYLTVKEFDLLWLLCKNPNKVFSKEELFEKIWGWDPIGDITTVTVHIRKLREKIERDPSNPQYIETIYGSGYRFNF